MRIKAVAFDFVGTLVKIEEREELALTKLYEALKSFGLKTSFQDFKEEYSRAASKYLELRRRTNKEVNNRVWLREALAELGFKGAGDGAILKTAVEAYFQPYIESARAPKEVYEVLSKLKGHYELGLISNFTDPPTVHKILRGEGLLEFFKEIVISGEVGWRKPHPAIFAKFLSSLSLNPWESAFVGDDPRYDVKGAKDAGMVTVLLVGGETRLSQEYYESRLGEEGARPDYTIRSISELPKLLSIIERARCPGPS